MYVEGSNIEVQDSDFTACSSYDGGGGIAMDESTATVSGTGFTSCSTCLFGGGIYMTSSTATVSGSSFNGCGGYNAGDYYSGGEGGGIYMISSAATLSGTSFDGCGASNYGPDIRQNGGTLTCSATCRRKLAATSYCSRCSASLIFASARSTFSQPT